MNPRIIFPTLMFILAGASFAFGGWQYVQARMVEAAAQKQVAFIATTIQDSSIAQAKKKELFASIMSGLPPSANVFRLDFSGSFASPGGDSCASDGQRAVCKALNSVQTDSATMTLICGACNPQ